MDKKSYDNGSDFSFVEQKVREVQTTIENAVKTSNYQELNQSITKMVNNTLKQYQKEHPATVQKKTEHKVMNQKIQETHPELYGNTGGEKVKDILLIVFGGLLSGSMAIGLLTVQILQAVIGHGGITSTAVTLIGTLAGVGMIYGGCTGLGRLKRFKKYVQALGDRTYCDFERLAGAVGRSVKFVKKDIKRMISKGWFLQGHVDKQETCLITSNETYDQYVSTQKRLEERNHQQAEERARQEAALRQQAEEKERQKFNQHEQADARACVEAERDAAERIRLSPEVRQVLDKGNDFLDKIHRSNDAIPGEEISRKISRMELIIAKIFERAKAHPEIIPDLNRLMDYYLPMTVKLLNAYEEMDSQPVQGENITSSKKEIEETIDTLNVAFEKLLDSIFEDTAMDVSSDISVLNTVLAQEGLTEDELTRMRKEAEKNRL